MNREGEQIRFAPRKQLILAGIAQWCYVMNTSAVEWGQAFQPPFILRLSENVFKVELQSTPCRRSFRLERPVSKPYQITKGRSAQSWIQFLAIIAFFSLFTCLLAFDFNKQHTKTGKKLPAKHAAAPLNPLFLHSSATSSQLTVHENDGRSGGQLIRWKSSLWCTACVFIHPRTTQTLGITLLIFLCFFIHNNSQLFLPRSCVRVSSSMFSLRNEMKWFSALASAAVRFSCFMISFYDFSTLCVTEKAQSSELFIC